MEKQDLHSCKEEMRLLELVASGDLKAFRSLYQKWSASLHALANSIVNDDGIAQEILQDTFLKIWQNATFYDPDLSRPFSWAIVICRRLSLNARRKIVKLPQLEELSEQKDSGGITDMEKIDALEHIKEQIFDMPVSQRKSLNLAYFKGYSHREIAKELQCPIGSVKTWIRNGLEILRRKNTEML